MTVDISQITLDVIEAIKEDKDEYLETIKIISQHIIKTNPNI